MALIQPGLIFRAEAAATLVVTARAQESLRVKKIFVVNPSVATQYATVINDTARVGFFRVTGKGGGHLLGPNSSGRGINILDFMTKHLAFPGYPVAAGESLTVSLDTGNGDIFILADAFEPADIRRDMPNGAAAADVSFVNYGSNSAAISAAGYSKLDFSHNPAEMSPFPFGVPGRGLVPANKRQEILMLGGQAVGRFTSAGNTANTRYLRPRMGAAPAATLFDRNDVGFQFFGTVPGAGVDYTGVRQNLFSAGPSGFPWTADEFDVVTPKLTFGPNEELALQVDVAIAGTGSLSAQDVDVWVITRIFPA